MNLLEKMEAIVNKAMQDIETCKSFSKKDIPMSYVWNIFYKENNGHFKRAVCRSYVEYQTFVQEAKKNNYNIQGGDMETWMFSNTLGEIHYFDV